MKASLRGMIVLVLVAVGPFLLRGQTNAAPQAPNSQVARELAFLTPDQQLQYAKAHQKALEDNPVLKSEGQDLLQQGSSLTADSPEADKQAFLEKMNSHRQKLRAAMLKEDPTLTPVFQGNRPAHFADAGPACGCLGGTLSFISISLKTSK